MAESFYHARNYSDALTAYGHVVRAYEQFGRLVGKARFRTARCFDKLNRRDEAKAMYGKIINEGGGDAGKAKALLEEMEKKELLKG